MINKIKSIIAGFSAIEVLVVISIIGVVTLITVPTYKEGGRTFALHAAAEQFISDMEGAKTQALAGKYQDPNNEPDSWGIVIRGTLPKTTYEIYASTVNLYQFDPAFDDTPILKTLPHGIEISALSEGPPLDLNYEFILGNFRKNVRVHGPIIPTDITTVTLRDPQNGATLVIELNQLGLVGTGTGAVCGNGVIEIGEECELPFPNRKQCQEINPIFDGQTAEVACSQISCRWNNGNLLDVCTIPPDPPVGGGGGGPGICGDGDVNQGEECDAGASTGALDPQDCCGDPGTGAGVECQLAEGCACNYNVNPNVCRQVGVFVDDDEAVVHGGGFPIQIIPLIDLGGFGGGFGGGLGGLGGGFGGGFGGFGGCYVLPQESQDKHIMTSSFVALMLLMFMPLVVVYGAFRIRKEYLNKRIR